MNASAGAAFTLLNSLNPDPRYCNRSSTQLLHANLRRPFVDEQVEDNFKSLVAFWRQSSVVGLTVESAVCLLDRCIVTFGNLVLVCDEVTEYVASVNALPTCLLEQEIDLQNGCANIQLITQNGSYSITCGKVRLFNRVEKSRLI